MTTTSADERLEAMRARDQRLCRCDHKCVSHGSFDDNGEFAGLGMAGCGICGCQQFAVPPT